MDSQLPQNDHDAIVTLISEVRQARADIKELRDGTKATIQEHETRLRKVEEQCDRDNTLSKLFIAIGIVVAAMLVWHMTGYKL